VYSSFLCQAISIVLRYTYEVVTKPSRRRIDYAALADFRYEIRRFLNFSESAARAAGIEPHQHQALLAIKGLPARHVATIGVLAERLQIQHHSAVELTDRLEAKGLILRSRGKADRREVLLELTLRGEKLLRELTLSHRSELQLAGPKLVAALESAIARGRRSGRKSNNFPPDRSAAHRSRRDRKSSNGR
jgi:DNA-binding MarR family transcriptional regulator